MKLVGIFLISACLSGVFGIPVEENCSGFLVPVIGNHYYKKQDCSNRNDETVGSPKELQNLALGAGMEEGSFLLNLSYVIQEMFHEDEKIRTVQSGNKALETPKDEPNIICTACKSLVKSVNYELSLNKTVDELVDMIGSLCEQFHIFNDDICGSYLASVGPPLVFILKTTTLSPDEVCSFISNTCVIDTPNLDWNIDIPGPIQGRTQNRIEYPKDGKPLLKVLHLSDTHFDPNYVENTLDDCDLPLCCRDPPSDPSDSTSGLFGGWKCDIPERTLDSLLDFVVNNISDIDNVIWTGDIPSHEVWNQTIDSNLDMVTRTINKMKKYFGSDGVVLPSLGNHEPVPGDLLATPLLDGTQWSSQWLYDALAQQWTDGWLPPDTTVDTIKMAAFYKTTYRPGLVLLSVNSVFCYTNNLFLILESKDPADELAWLVNELLEAEANGEKVHIAAHIPPSNPECLQVWQKNFYRIVERFRDTITGQFYGHTHNEEFALVLGEDDPHDTPGVMLIGGSATTYTYLNPSFRILYIDGDYENTTREVVDFDTWIMDLEESNRLSQPIWRKLYSARADLGLESLRPSEWRKLYERLKTDDDLLQKYHRYFWKDSPMRPTCDPVECRELYLCLIVSCTKYGKPALELQ